MAFQLTLNEALNGFISFEKLNNNNHQHHHHYKFAAVVHIQSEQQLFFTIKKIYSYPKEYKCK